jgi:hypothetical protein
MWQRVFKRKISWDFAVLGKVISNRGRFLGRAPSDGDRRLVDICLTLIMSKPRSTSPLEMSWAGVFVGRWRITALMGFSDFGKKVN